MIFALNHFFMLVVFVLVFKYGFAVFHGSVTIPGE